MEKVGSSLRARSCAKPLGVESPAARVQNRNPPVQDQGRACVPLSAEGFSSSSFGTPRFSASSGPLACQGQRPASGDRRVPAIPSGTHKTRPARPSGTHAPRPARPSGTHTPRALQFAIQVTSKWRKAMRVLRNLLILFRGFAALGLARLSGVATADRWFWRPTPECYVDDSSCSDLHLRNLAMPLEHADYMG